MLTNADVERFNRESYPVIDDIVDERALAALREEYADLMDRLYARIWRGVPHIPQHRWSNDAPYCA